MTTKTEMNWQEVAEETARNLGWEFRSWAPYGGDENWVRPSHGHWAPLFLEFDPESSGDSRDHIEYYVFCWKTFGEIVEKAEEMGWDFEWKEYLFSFVIPGDEYDHVEEKRTRMYSAFSNKKIKAACLAFNEIFKMEKSNDNS